MPPTVTSLRHQRIGPPLDRVAGNRARRSDEDLAEPGPAPPPSAHLGSDGVGGLGSTHPWQDGDPEALRLARGGKQPGGTAATSRLWATVSPRNQYLFTRFHQTA